MKTRESFVAKFLCEAKKRQQNAMTSEEKAAEQAETMEFLRQAAKRNRERQQTCPHSNETVECLLIGNEGTFFGMICPDCGKMMEKSERTVFGIKI